MPAASASLAAFAAREFSSAIRRDLTAESTLSFTAMPLATAAINTKMPKKSNRLFFADMLTIVLATPLQLLLLRKDKKI